MVTRSELQKPVKAGALRKDRPSAEADSTEQDRETPQGHPKPAEVHAGRCGNVESSQNQQNERKDQ